MVSRKYILFDSTYKGKTNNKKNNKKKIGRKNSKDKNNKLNKNDINNKKSKIKNAIIKGNHNFPNTTSNISLYNNNKGNNIINRNNNISNDNSSCSSYSSMIEDSFKQTNKTWDLL